MNLFTIKYNMGGNPNQEKSYIVALENLEHWSWSQEDKYTLVLSTTTCCLLVCTVVDDRYCLKQGDYKNVFCNGILHNKEICIVKLPTRCPQSKSGSFWKINKIIYRLTRSTHHWYTKNLNHITLDMGFASIDWDYCAYIFFFWMRTSYLRWTVHWWSCIL